MNSLRTVFLPISAPTMDASFHSTPIIQARGEQNQPRTLASGRGLSPRLGRKDGSQFTRATNAIKHISTAATLIASLAPSIAPRQAASRMFASSFGILTFTIPLVTDCSVSGTLSLRQPVQQV